MCASPAIVILGWARTAVAPAGGAFCMLHPHELGAPVIGALLERAGIQAEAVDAVVAGNALGAGGNPARMIALAAGLPDRVAALTLDSQCCAGLDAVTVAAGLLGSGAAELIVAGGVEAWSRAPLRHHRPISASEAPVPYERPAFAPDPARDPDFLAAAASLANRRGIDRAAQDAFAAESHARALAFRHAMRAEIVMVSGLGHDPYARPLSPAVLSRIPIAARFGEAEMSRAALAPKADGAAFVIVATEDKARRLMAPAHFAFIAGASVGSAPEVPMLAAIPASLSALERAGTGAGDLSAVEVHEAFAVQALCLIRDLGLDPARVSRGGGGLARGHPIGASGAISLVRLLADMKIFATSGDRGLATIAAVGGLGSAIVIELL